MTIEEINKSYSVIFGAKLKRHRGGYDEIIILSNNHYGPRKSDKIVRIDLLRSTAKRFVTYRRGNVYTKPMTINSFVMQATINATEAGL